MRLDAGFIDPDCNLCRIPASLTRELTQCLQLSNRWKELLASMNVTQEGPEFEFSLTDVNVIELKGERAAEKALWELGSRGMTVAQLITSLEKLKWEQELRLLKPPEGVAITLQPQSQHVREGDVVYLRCAATGFPLPRYDWLVSKQKGAEAREFDNPTRINNELHFPCVRCEDGGKYVCKVSNDYSWACSKWSLLKVEPDPVALAEREKEMTKEQDKQLTLGGEGDGVDGAGPLTPDGTTVLHPPPQPPPGPTTEFGPYITHHPPITPVHVRVGDPITLSIRAHAQPPPVYQWYRVHREKRTKHVVERETAPVLRIERTKVTDNGDYYCKVSNHISSVESEICPLVIHLHELPDHPKIEHQSQSQRKMVGDKATLSVQASGRGELAFQWYKDGRLLKEETKHMLDFRIKSAKDAGTFECSVTCPETGNQARTKPIRLDVTLPPRDAQTFQAQDKVALVIASCAYETRHAPLSAPIFDAIQISALLTQLQFSVISLLDPTKEEILESIELFCALLATPSDRGTAHHSGMYGVFYWAGHGCYYHGDSYLIPYNVGVNCSLDDFISVEYIRSKMLHMDPSLCLLLLDMCRQEAASHYLIPQDFRAHVDNKSVGTRRDNGDAAYGNHCTIYATSIHQEAFETGKDYTSIFMQCLTSAIKKPHKNISQMYEALLEDLGKKNPKADERQNPEIVSNLKQNRTLHDPKDIRGFTEIVDWRLTQWVNTQGLPPAQLIEFPNEQMQLEVRFSSSLSNVMSMEVSVVRLGRVVTITNMRTTHEPQQVDIVPGKHFPVRDHTWVFQISALQRLKKPLVVVLNIEYTFMNNRTHVTACQIDLGQPLISGSSLWNESKREPGAMEGAAGGPHHPGAYAEPHHPGPHQLGAGNEVMPGASAHVHVTYPGPVPFPVPRYHHPQEPKPEVERLGDPRPQHHHVAGAQHAQQQQQQQWQQQQQQWQQQQRLVEHQRELAASGQRIFQPVQESQK